MYQFIKLVSVFFFLFSLSGNAQNSFSKNEHEELGAVTWHRSYEQAIALAKEEKKPVLILFQEVPGCATCRNYGHNVLSHPLMVEAIENYFIPVAIFNNKGGKDKEILKKYNEPAWNNPVVRIIDSNEKSLASRVGNDYSALTLCRRMKEALIKNGSEVPEFLNLLELELSSIQLNTIDETHFKMYCFWTGEKELGKLEGVVSTQSGFMGHNEVVKVRYNKQLITKETLVSQAEKHHFYPINKGTYNSAPNDIHYYLQHSKYKFIPLTELQQTKINSALGNRKSGHIYLSPKQKKWFKQLTASAQFSLSTDFFEAWQQKEQQDLNSI